MYYKENEMDTQIAGYKAKAFEGRNLVWYFLIVMGIPYLAMALFVLRIMEFPAKPGPGLMIVLAIVQFLPLIAAFLLTGLSEGKPGMKALWKRFWNRDLHIPWLLVALLLNPAIRLVNSLIDRAISGASYPILIPDFLSAFLFGIVVGIREEFGWRGYVLPRFQAKWNALSSSIILGILWAAWHWGQWVVPGSNLYERNFWLWNLGWR